MPPKRIMKTPKKSNVTSFVRMDPSASTTSEPSTVIDDSGFTMVSHKKGRVSAHVHQPMANAQSSEASHTTMKTVTSWKNFKEFQTAIVPIIEKIITDEAVSEHPFTQRWVNAKIMA